VSKAAGPPEPKKSPTLRQMMAESLVLANMDFEAASSQGSLSTGDCVCVCTYMYMYVCAYVCVCVCTCVCVCVCVCVYCMQMCVGF
jgi:hypothetical protein